ncbi:hypothetical protein EMA8858_03012 [Emticicia aquatica]|jgi:hypothetical protein|uniref:Lipocalin-like domain-containing protein n=1 Tax=Emticicia aquatica TaxID=1681835 RepID=A0ABM9ATN3_9BACT|nr:hypothetical protein [Emticicia aquatica]CAH0996877.1 hypothetical protein EMA8858_03012 [Emticicia aquatica]
MKNLIFLLIVSSSIMFSCTKEDVVADNSITGEWRWVTSTGGIAGTTITPSSAGFERKLVFTSDLKFSRYKDNILEKSGTFEITQAKSIYKTDLADFIKFNDNTSSVILSQKADELILADNLSDGFVETYQRIKK